MCIFRNWSDSIFLEFEIFRIMERWLEDNLPSENVISILIIGMRIIEVVVIFVGGFLSIVFFAGIAFAVAWIINLIFR